MNNMTKRLLAFCCVLPLYANACEGTAGHKTSQAETRAVETRTAAIPAAETGPGANTAVAGKEEPSKLKQFLDLPPASDTAKKRMKKR